MAGLFIFMVKDYYAILSVARNASENEIKRSFRRLAVLYHPDKNPDPAAENKFKEINEAYDVLSDPEKKFVYDQRLDNPLAEAFDQNSASRHRDPAYRRRKSSVRVKTERERLQEFMTRFYPWAYRSIVIALAVALLLTFDFLLPTKTAYETIAATEIKRTFSRRSSTSWWVIRTNTGHTVEVPYSYSDHFSPGQPVKIYSSLMLSVPVKVAGLSQTVAIQKSIYRSFIFAPLALLITASLGFYFRKNIERCFRYGVISSILLALTVIIFLILK